MPSPYLKNSPYRRAMREMQYPVTSTPSQRVYARSRAASAMQRAFRSSRAKYGTHHMKRKKALRTRKKRRGY